MFNQRSFNNVEQQLQEIVLQNRNYFCRLLRMKRMERPPSVQKLNPKSIHI